jgi:superfamily II DNA or RNA helicase
MIREIRSGKLNGLCTVGIGIEGMDLPGLYGLIWMRRTMSLTIYLQFIGRVLRPLSGKEYGIIIDGVGNCFIHGRPELDRQWSLESDYKPDEQKAPRMRICPVCKVMNAYENTKCHICGSDLLSDENKKERKLPVMVDGKLVVLSEDDQDVEWLKNRIQEKKIENIELLKEEKKVELQEVSKSDKMKILSKNLTGKKVESIFQETLSKYI